MLVLNTNSGGENIGNRVSNTFLGGYPDFSQILLKPGNIGNASSFNPANNVILSVNGTPIHHMCPRLSEATYFKGSSTAGNYGEDGSYIWNNSKSITAGATVQVDVPEVNISTLGQFYGGEIVGRHIYAEIDILQNCSDGSCSVAQAGTYNLGVHLLHTDGTISSIGTITLNPDTKLNGVMFRKAIETQGLVAQEGDRILIKLSATSYWKNTYTQTWNYPILCGFSFGYDGSASNSPGIKCCPIQISVE